MAGAILIILCLLACAILIKQQVQEFYRMQQEHECTPDCDHERV